MPEESDSFDVLGLMARLGQTRQLFSTLLGPDHDGALIKRIGSKPTLDLAITSIQAEVRKHPGRYGYYTPLLGDLVFNPRGLDSVSLIGHTEPYSDPPSPGGRFYFGFSPDFDP